MIEEMIKKARVTMDNAYAPYSNFHVGVCMRSEDDELFVGCNVENVIYVAIHAEAAAISSLISAGKKKIKEVVEVGSGGVLVTPCGLCRQMIYEFAESDETPIHLSDGKKIVKTFAIGELLPEAFGPKHLKG